KLSIDYPNANIFFLGGNGHIIENEYDEITVAKSFFNDVGFDLNKIKFLGNTRNTIENLQAYKKLKNSSNKTILITSGYHMKRSLLIAKYLKLDLIPYAVDFRTSPNSSLLNKYQDFNITRNLTYFNIFLREYLGILAFKLFY
ncbi:YdcF family protein, partial [Candidatus Pelagibacter sp.]|nr:YdcF family protein [Candidatus Pelagibacter sp.]